MVNAPAGADGQCERGRAGAAGVIFAVKAHGNSPAAVVGRAVEITPVVCIDTQSGKGQARRAVPLVGELVAAI